MGNDNSSNEDNTKTNTGEKKPDPPEDSTYINRTHNDDDDDDQNRMIRRTVSNRSSKSNKSNRSTRSDDHSSRRNGNGGDGGQQPQPFSPIRGHMDDSTNFEYANESHNLYQSAINSSDDLDNDLNLNNSNISSNKNLNNTITNQSDDDYDEEEEYTATSPVNLYDLTASGTSSKNNNSNSNTNTKNNSNRLFGGNSTINENGNNRSHSHPLPYPHSHSNLLARHITRVAFLSPEEYDNADIEMSPALKRRLRDFRFAQRKRRERYGEQNPWGIIGLYDHLTGIRTDIEWAEDAAWRRENDQPYLSWQDFEDAKDTGFNQPFFTYFTMLVCTICLIVSIGLNGWKVQPLTNNPMIGPSAVVLLQMGAKQTSLIVNQNEWYRIFTCMFLHAGIIHFVVNMLALWFIGYAVEQSHGFFAAATLFILPAIGGTLLSALFLPEFISVGASGGIFGLIGACIADIISNWGLLFSRHVNDGNVGQRFRHVKVLIWLVLDIILNIVIGLTPFVDNFTHMGGMFFGFFCGLSTMERLSKAFFGVKTNFMSRLQTFLVRFFGIIFSVICILVGFIVLASLKDGQMIPCRWCRYISCVPFPFWETEDKWWYCDDCNKPIVRAKLYQDSSSLFYTHMDLVCPDNSTVTNIALVENTDDQEYFQKKLASYCREECDVLFSN